MYTKSENGVAKGAKRKKKQKSTSAEHAVQQ
jgi:hypothetical protein